MPPRDLSIQGAENGGSFGMVFHTFHQLAVALAEVHTQFFIVVAIIEPAAMVKNQRRDDYPRRIGADLQFCPVVRI